MPDRDAVTHTPGPWAARPRNWRNEPDPYRMYVDGDHHVTHDDDDDVGCEVATAVAIVEGNATSLGVTAANARLIAAAPDLLKALADLCDWCEALDFDGSRFIADSVARARAVIARAIATTPDPEGANEPCPDRLP